MNVRSLKGKENLKKEEEDKNQSKCIQLGLFFSNFKLEVGS